MGLSFIGNPFEQEDDAVEDELEWSEVEDNIQNIFVVRIPVEDERNDLDLTVPETSEDSDEDFVPASDSEEEESVLEYASSDDDLSVPTLSFSEDEEAPESYESFLANVFEKFDGANVEDETD